MSGKTGRGPASAEDLRAMLGPLQEKKGYYFNTNEKLTTPLLEQLLVTKERYGYMACPCRLANGSQDLDRDIICPCRYREDDVKEYNVCFCGLYVSEACKDKPVDCSIPDRRPPERIVFPGAKG